MTDRQPTHADFLRYAHESGFHGFRAIAWAKRMLAKHKAVQWGRFYEAMG